MKQHQEKKIDFIYLSIFLKEKKLIMTSLNIVELN